MVVGLGTAYGRVPCTDRINFVWMRGAGSSGLMDTIKTGDASVLMMRIRRQELSGDVNGCIVLERDTGAEYVLTFPGVIGDRFWGAKHGLRTVLDGWLETRQSLFVYLDHVGWLAE
ncbi:hypothetical protein F2Q70_00015915 [Brassica cretica]|uniref:Uncharacterized protein n=1 Tax=Brassica cretica TaxID=69181 RepID=A0A8S9I017_BRACR|nr:hypothetical protein F2Q70_00015915 [Brassica cretica]